MKIVSILVAGLLLFVTVVNCGIITNRDTNQCSGLPDYTRLKYTADPVNNSTETDSVDDCEKYIECLNEEENIEECPEPFHFNSKTGGCDWKNEAGCSVDPNLDLCKGKKAGDVIAVADSCTEYVLCVEDGDNIVSEPNDCAADEQIFNPNAVGYCSKTTEWWCPLNATRPDCSLITDQKIFLPVPNSCSEYFQCYKGVLLKGTCGNGLHMDFSNNRCIYDIDSNCTEDGGSTGGGNSVKDICADGKGPFVPDESVCTAYYYCVSDVLPSQTFCPNGFYYSDLKCEKKRPKSCSCEYIEDGKFVEHQDKDRYWECTANGRELRVCPSGLLFDGIACGKA